MQHSRDLQDLMDSKRDADRRNAALLEENAALRDQLAAANDKLTAANEQLTTANEQLTATNEQLTKANEQIASASASQTDPELPLPLEPCQTTGSDNSDEISEAYDMLQNEYDDLKQKFDEVVNRTKSDNGNQTEVPTTSTVRNGFELMPNVEDYNEKIRALNEEVSQLKTKENELHSRIEELEDKLQQKIDDEKSVSYQLEEKAIEISQLTEHNRFLQEEMQSLKDKLRDLDENVTVEDIKKANESAIAKKDEVIEKLKAELESVEKALREKESEVEEWGNNDAWGASDDVKEELEKLVVEKQELIEVIQNHETLIAKLEADLTRVKEEKEAEVSGKLEQDAMVKELKSKVETLEASLKQKEQELEGWTDNDNWGSSGNEQDIEALKKENEEIKEKLAKQESTLAKLKTHSESLQKQLLEKEMELEEWGNNDSWGGDNDKLATLQQENKVLNEKVSELQTQLLSVEEALKKKENDLEDWGEGDDWGTGNSTELNNLRAKCSEFEKTIVELKSQEELLKQALIDKENELSEWGQTNEWGSPSSSDLNTLREESGLLREKLSEQKVIISKLKTQLEAAQQGTSSHSHPVDQQVQDRDSRIEMLSRENEGLRTRVEQLGLVIENNYVQESDPMNNSLDNTAQLTAEKERLDEEVTVLSQENIELKKKLEQAVEKQKGLEEEIQQLEEDTSILREQLESKDQVDDSIEKTLRNEIQELHAKLINVEALVNQAQVEKQALDGKYEELKEKYEQMSEKFENQTGKDSVDIDTLIKNLQSKKEELCRLLDEKNTLDNIKVEKENLEIQLDNLNTNYQDKINTLIQSKNDLEAKISELNNAQHNKNNEINDLNKRISLFEENNAFLQRSILDLERNLDEKLKEFNEKEISYNENIEASNHKIQQLTQETDKLKAELVAQAESTQLVKQEQALLAAAPVDDNIVIENQQLKQNLESVKQENTLVVENLQNLIAQKDYEINAKVTELSIIMEKCKQYEDKCIELESTLDAKLTDFSTKEQLNKNKMAELSAMLESVQAENISIKQMNEELQALTETLKQTSNTHEEDRKILDEYKQRVQELDGKLAEEIASKTSIIQTLEIQVKELQDKLSSYTHVENELGQYRSKVYELEQIQARLEAERTQWIHEFEVKTNTLSDLQTQLDTYNAKITHAALVEQELGEMKNQMQTLEYEKQELLKQIQEESIASNFLKNELQSLQDAFSVMKSDNASLLLEKNTFMETKLTLEAQLKELADNETQYKQMQIVYEDTQRKLNEELARRDATIPTLNTTGATLNTTGAPDVNASIENILKEKDATLSEMLKKCEAKDKTLQEMQAALDKHLSEKYQFEKEALELRNKMATYDNEIQLLRSTAEDLEYKLQEKEKMIQELNEMKQSFFIGDSKDSVSKSQESSTTLTLLQSELAEQRTLNQQLVQIVNTKHTESNNYHQEILRLNGILSEELPKLKDLGGQVATLEKQLKTTSETLATKERQLAETKEQLSLTQSQLEEVTQLMSSNDRPEADGEPAQEREVVAQHVAPVETSRERNELALRLQNLQEEKTMLLTEINDLRLNQNTLYNENERLKQHLLKTEEDNTSELVKAEQTIQDLHVKLREAEERVKSSATAYTSASVRSNQQVEALTSQVKSLTEQKEKLQEKLYQAEDVVQKHQASLTNLQIVLEQFQAEKDNEIAQSLEFLQGELNNSYAKNSELTQLISTLQHQLQEARESLSAAGRLSDQLNQKSQTIQELTEKVNQLMEELNKKEAKLKEVNNGGKVDKCLVTNMIVNFLTAPSRPSRHQALQILASVIDMTPQDRQKIGLEPSQAFNPNQSLSEAFIQFLESESSPRSKAQSSTPVSRRTSSTTSPLLFPESALPSLPQFSTMASGSMLKDVLHSDS
ncbi:hypothetical protein M8J75_012850 [Diaphorina citri]|nr:hypothetical protein M8J75_012850 [Diaphorina citri]